MIRQAVEADRTDIINVSKEMWGHLIDDGINGLSQYPDNISLDNFLILKNDTKCVGFVQYRYLSSICMEIHPCIVKSCTREEREVETEVLREYLVSIGIEQAVVLVPSDSRHITILLAGMGFRQTGVIRNAYRKDNKIFNLDIYSNHTKEWK